MQPMEYLRKYRLIMDRLLIQKNSKTGFQAGFQHKTMTPKHPKAQGQVEGLNKLVNKSAVIANQESIDVKEATYDMLQAYRSTPHPATKETPYELMMNRQIRTKIEHFPISTSSKDKDVSIKDSKYKEQVKKYHDKRRQTREHKTKIADAVVVKRERKRKVETPYEPYIYMYCNGSQRIYDLCQETSERWEDNMQRCIKNQTIEDGRKA